MSQLPSSEVAGKKENKPRNRYLDVLPYDYNRVSLVAGSNDYINASFLQSKDTDAAHWRYIATQVKGLPSQVLCTVFD